MPPVRLVARETLDEAADVLGTGILPRADGNLDLPEVLDTEDIEPALNVEL